MAEGHRKKGSESRPIPESQQMRENLPMLKSRPILTDQPVDLLRQLPVFFRDDISGTMGG
jgi:hypothetical protein